MPRLRGAITTKPEGDGAWAILNEQLFGDHGIGGHFVSVRPEVLPFDWEKVFNRRARLGLEIGFNRGRFLRGLAARFPERDFIGIEVRRRYCWRLAKMLAESSTGPRNVRIIWADAKAITRSLFAADTVNDIFVTFPDPWWKKRHAKRRLVDTRFAQDMATLLPAGGRIWVKSDVRAIRDEIAEALVSIPSLSSPVSFEQDELPLTHRETKCIAHGQPIFRFRVEHL